MSLIVPVPLDAALGWCVGRVSHDNLVSLWRKVDVARPFALQVVTWSPGLRGMRSLIRQVDFWFLNPNCRVAVAFLHTERTAKAAAKQGWRFVFCPGISTRTPDGIFMAKENPRE